MKNNIKNVYKTGIIITICLAFVTPSIAFTEKNLSKETSVFADATFEWIPVSASGLHTIVGNEIYLHETEQIVTLEIYVSDWYPHLLKALQATVDSVGYSNGVGGTLNPFGWPGSPEDGCFIDTSRTDYVFYGMVGIDAVYTGDLDYIWGATLLISEKEDDGYVYYLGTLILEIPIDASSTYTIGFLPDSIKTFMQNENGQNIVPLILSPVLITINQLPNAPTITGPLNGNVGTSYPYTFTSIDPDSDDIAEYIINWGDGPDEIITGPFASGAPQTISHKWTSQGTFTITAKAKDINGLIGPEGTETVTMPRNHAIKNTMFQWFLEQFSILNRLFQNLGLQ